MTPKGALVACVSALALTACDAPAPGGAGGPRPDGWSSTGPAASGWRDGAAPASPEARTRGLGGDRTGAWGADSNDARTTAIVERLNRVWQECEALPRREYRIDCLSEGYVRAAAVIPQDATFGDGRQAILAAAGRLNALAQSTGAGGLPDLPASGRTRPLRAVDPARLAAANAAATRIIEETETILLRASTASQDRRVPFQRIAQAVGSSKTLLRS